MRFLLILPLLLATAHADKVPLEKWLQRQASISSLDVSFTQERKLPALKEPVTTAGRFYFSKPDQVRWQLGEPLETLAVSNGNTLTLVDATAKTARRTSTESPQAARFSLLAGKAFESIEQFDRTFEIVESSVTSGIYQYTLKPKDRRIRSQIPWIFLDIDPLKIELRALEIELQDRSRLRTTFHHPRFNLKLEPALFSPDLTGYDVK